MAVAVKDAGHCLVSKIKGENLDHKLPHRPKNRFRERVIDDHMAEKITSI